MSSERGTLAPFPRPLQAPLDRVEAMFNTLDRRLRRVEWATIATGAVVAFSALVDIARLLH